MASAEEQAEHAQQQQQQHVTQQAVANGQGPPMDPEEERKMVYDLLKEEGLCLEGYEVDHIVPRSLGGADHPHNYALVTQRLNRQWAGDWTADKRHELGPCAVRQALDFAQWSAAQSTVPYSCFVPRRGNVF